MDLKMEEKIQNQGDSIEIADRQSMAELGKKKILVEIARLESETKKFESERKHLDRPLYSLDKLIPIILAGFVAAGLLSAWAVGYFQPILNKNQEIAKLNIEELSLKAKIQENNNVIEKNEINKISLRLSEENSKIKNDLEALISQNKILENDQKKVVVLAENFRKELDKAKDKYLELSKRYNLTIAEREKYAELVIQSEERIISLSQEIQQLQEAKEATVSRTNELTEKRDKYVTFGGKTLTFGGKPLTFGDK